MCMAITSWAKRISQRVLPFSIRLKPLRICPGRFRFSRPASALWPHAWEKVRRQNDGALFAGQLSRFALQLAHRHLKQMYGIGSIGWKAS